MLERLRRWVPWVSLCVGLGGAFVMDRGPERAKLVAVATVAVWITLIILHRLLRRDARPIQASDLEAATSGEGVEAAAPTSAEDTGWVVRVARMGSLFATQSLLQLLLFFAVPFYWQAATRDVGHGVFLALLMLLCGVALWDPWTEWLLKRPVVSALLPALASFVALNAVLPGLGISTQLSLWASSIFAALGVPLAGTAHKRRGRSTALLSLVVAAALPGSLLVGGARIVPAAPLKLVRADIGTQRAGKWVQDPVEQLDAVPERLICATAIDSPVGLHDRLFHVWRKNGELRSRIELKIVGGRKGGYRTQSHIRHLGKHPTGTYRCTVETATGQVLGSRSVRIVAP